MCSIILQLFWSFCFLVLCLIWTKLLPYKKYEEKNSKYKNCGKKIFLLVLDLCAATNTDNIYFMTKD